MSSNRDVIDVLQQIREIEVDPESAERALKRARQSLLQSTRSPRAERKRLLLPVAASLLSLATVLLLAVVFSWQLVTPAAAFGQMQRRVEGTRSITFAETTFVNGVRKESVRATNLATGLARLDLADGSYSILDSLNRKSMAVTADRSRAMIWHERPGNVPPNLYDYIKNLHQDSVRRLPERMIGETTAIGYSVDLVQEVQGERLEHTVSIWVDPASSLPMRMESVSAGGVLKVVDDIRFDVDVDRSLVRLVPPEGAVVQEFGPAQPITNEVQTIVDQIGDTSDSETGEAEVSSLSRALRLWEGGQKDAAIEALVAVPWNDRTAIGEPPLMKLTESQFMGLPASDRMRVQQEGIEFARTAKSIYSHAVVMGEQLQQAGDQATAQQYYTAVQQFGVALTDAERLKVLQLVGKALVAMTEGKLNALGE